ncbi:AAA family ATPase [Flavobacterium sp. LB3P21]|uniref:AAA family ATPase n=1 Tax=Flavobacterium sp. LB3P21 TaxID=3401719 RepID=UPI003AB0AC8B
MKILSLFISKYKNIPEKEICFDTDLTSLIIGQNGLGKSNLLEAITLIFVAISNKDKEVNFLNFEGKFFSFRISYLLRGKQIEISYGIENLYQINIVNGSFKVTFEPGSGFELDMIGKINEELVPDYFVTYYSGQNRRLEKILKNFEINYFDGLKRNKDNSALTSRRKFLYLKNYHAPILLLTLSIFKDFEKNGSKIYEKQIVDLFKHLNISTLESFTLNVKSPYWINNSYKQNMREDDKLKMGHVSYIHTSLENPNKYPFPFWNLKSSINKLFHALVKSVDVFPFSNEDEISKNIDFKEFIDFNGVEIKTLQKYIFNEFDSPLELFYTIEALSLLDIVDFENDLKFEIKKQQSTDLTFDLLSEGENQLLIVLGIVLITGSDETLCLLDEPDTYLNPKWQREYVQLLESFNLEDDDSHVIVTTHSPLLVQNMEGESNYKYDLILLYRNEDGNVVFDQDKGLIKNWRIDQVLSSKYFDLVSTRPKSLDVFMKKRLEIIRRGNLTAADRQELEVIENEMGFLPTGETILEIESQAIIKDIADLKRGSI